MLLLGAFVWNTHAGPLRAGAARVDITPPAGARGLDRRSDHGYISYRSDCKDFTTGDRTVDFSDTTPKMR
jgi:hypothetical protein